MKSLNIDDIQAFLFAVERQSITESARRLGLSKSVVSKRISDLERKLGVQLLMRSTRNVTPTEAGMTFYRAASESMRRLVDVAEEIAERSHGLCGELRITSPVSLTRRWLGPAIAKFAAAHPQLRVTLETDDRTVNLEVERFDVALRSARPSANPVPAASSRGLDRSRPTRSSSAGRRLAMAFSATDDSPCLTGQPTQHRASLHDADRPRAVCSGGHPSC
ncbi:LysR family transcriptional regulator [Burkholderia anthina]|nr:LysR family transcriptional regulator [Burkholderia anthina]